MTDSLGAPTPITEAQAQEGFHAFLKGALAQAHAERLLDAETLSSAESDLMVEGPALCMFFAALKSSTHPPSVILPASQSDPDGHPLILDITTCPPSFRGLFRLWSSTVQQIQSLPSDYQHDLARLICDKEPLTSPVREQLPRLAGDLRAVAIEISQRRTFQERYGSDLQAVLDTSGPSRPGDKLRASFVPPPSYEEAPPEKPLVALPQRRSPPSTPPARHGDTLHPPSPSPEAPPSPLYNPSRAHLVPPSPSATRSGFLTPGDTSRHSSRPSTPTFLPEDSPMIDLIRETLYAALAEVIATTPGLRRLIHTDPPLAYFASVALAILSVGLTRVNSDGSIRAVLDRKLTEADVPPGEYKAFMRELGRIGARAKLMGEEDDERAMRYAQQGREGKEPRLDRLRRQIEKGAGGEIRDDGRVRTPSGTVTALANRINALALGMTRLRAFQERQGEIFNVLAGVAQ